jgi:hypothetical protein
MVLKNRLSKYRIIAGICILATLVWCGLWFFAQYQTKTIFNAWMQDRRAEGWTVPQNGFSVTGFPNRLDVTAEPWQLDDPKAGWAWQAPFLKLYALVYRPFHSIVRFAPEQTVYYTDSQNNLHEILVQSDPLEASVIFDNVTDPKPAIKQLDFSGENVAITSVSETSKISDLKIHLRQKPDSPNDTTYDLVTVLNGLQLPEGLWNRIDPQKKLGELKQTFRSEVTLSLQEPLTTKVLDGVSPNITRVDVQKLSLEMNTLKLNATGILELAPEGWPVGDLDMIVHGWQETLAIAQQSELLSENNAAAITMALQFLSGGNQSQIRVPLSFKRGRIFIGPIPIARAPILSKPETSLSSQ